MAESNSPELPLPLPPPRPVSSQLTDDDHTTAAMAAAVNHTAAFWRSCLTSGLRAALACTIVGVVSVYGPAALRRHLTFPAFSYVTTVLVVTAYGPTLGGALHGAACALYATVIGAIPSVLALWLAQRTGVSVAATTAVVALSTFAVALPESAGPVTKRIALGQVVIIYVANFRQGSHPSHVQAILHPAHVVACTVLGVLAAILALVLPCPRLATHEVREKSKLYREMAIERLRLFVEAFCADNTSCMAASTSQAKCFTSASTKLLHNIQSNKANLQWERPPLKFLQPLRSGIMPLDKLQDIDMPLKGMEIALLGATKPAVPMIRCFDQQLASNLLHLRDQISLSLLMRQNHYCAEKNKALDKSLQPISVIPQIYRDLAPFFFLFSLKLLQHGPLTAPPTANAGQAKVKVMPTTGPAMDASSAEEPVAQMRTKSGYSVYFLNLTRQRVVVALKCSFSLGLAVLLGLLFSNENGYWSGLIVATTMTLRRESTFKLANARAQGTALGSVYGVLGCLISQNLMELRFLALLPWIVFASFLRHSRMYGQAGGIAAVLSAIIIMGRRNYGPPMAFTIARLTETFIGLSCSILSELLFQPTRASTMARTQLSRSLRALRSCMASVTPSPGSAALTEQKKLQGQVNALKKCATEAGAEPNLWFLPFPIASYNKLHGSLSRMAQLVYFQAHAMELAVELCHRMGVPWEEVQEKIHADMEQFKKLASSSLQCLEGITHVKSLARLDKDFLEARARSDDLEVGKHDVGSCRYGSLSGGDGEESEEVVSSFLGHVKEAMERMDGEVGGDLKGQAIVCMASIGFCMGGLTEEARNLEAGVLELIQWENPGRHINLHEIWCEIRDVSER